MAHTRRSLLAAGALAAAIAISGACGGGDEQPAPRPDTPAVRTMDSTEVLAFLAAVDQSEVQAAQIGTRRASDAEVRRFAQLLWREHAQSGRDVADLARQMNVDLRAAPPPQSPMIANLRTRSQQTSQLLDRTPKSAAFDRTFLDSQVRAHQALIQDLRRIVGDSGRRVAASLAPGGGVDVGVTGRPDTAAAAAANRPANRKPENAQDAAQIMLARVQQHLERARQLQARPGGATTSTSSPPARSSARAPRRRAGARP